MKEKTSKSKDAATDQFSSFLTMTDANFNLPPSNIKWWKKLHWVSDVLRHSFFLFLLGAILLPFLIYLFNSYKSLEDAQQKKALEIISDSSNFEGEIASLYKDLGLFHEDNNNLFKKLIQDSKDLETLKKIEANRNDFKKFFNPRYSNFEKSGDENLWIDNLYSEGIALKLFTIEDVNKLNSLEAESSQNLDQRLKNLSENIKEYKASFKNTKRKLAEYKLNLINEDADFIKVFKSGNLNDEINKEREKRKLIVQKIIGIFAPKSWWKLW